MKIYRIARTEFCDISGEGAKRYGGRWNPPGLPVLYGSSTIATALLERLTIDPEMFSAERYVLYSVMEFDCPDRLVFIPPFNKLPEGWDAIPAERCSQQFGADLIQSGVVCFAVPSVVDKTSLNYVINPLAKEFERLLIKVYPLELDKRVVKVRGRR
jgi:RES domain-containing protein